MRNTNEKYKWKCKMRNINGNTTVSRVNDIVGDDNTSIICFIESSIDYIGPDIPPSFLILQKCTAIKIIAINGTAMQCST